MKLSFRDIEPFVQSPNPAARVILVYGPDHGLMKERTAIMGKTVVSDLSDPFNVAVISSDILTEDPARLSDEANAMSMMGGQRLIRVEAASDKIAPLVKDYLAAPNDQALVILEAGDLGPRSSLRKLCESAKNAAAVPCYTEDERDLTRTIRQIIQEAGQNIDQDAVTWLAANISGDRRKVRMELDKLITYKGQEGGAITLSDAQAACGAIGASNMDDLIYAIAGGQGEKALKIYNILLQEGVAVIAILRSMQNHFRRLHLVQSHIQDGLNTDDALKKLQPPLFFKYKSPFQAQLSRWSAPVLLATLERLNELEAQSKTTGSQPEILCGQAILSLSARGSR